MAFNRHSLWPERTWIRALIAAFTGVLVITAGHFIKHIPEVEHAPTLKSILDFSGELLREVGFALIVSSAIYLTFEFFSKEAAESEWRARIETITSEVFYGVLRRNLPKALLAEANHLILSQSFVREGLDISYLMEDAVVPNNGANAPYVKLTATLRYRIRNISDGVQTFHMAVAVPNPNVPALKPLANIINASYVMGGNRHYIDVDGKRADFHARLTNSSESHVVYNCAEIEISPQGDADIVIQYVMPKEEEDTEVFETIYPSDSIRVMIIDRGDSGRRIGATAHHPGELEVTGLVPEGGPYEYRLNRYLLPHQGVSIWWKKAQILDQSAGKVEENPLKTV